jgi:nucleoside-diphosphate-sugar epimerase
MDLHGDDPLACAQTNLLGTVNLFDAAARHGLSRVVWASTIMVYGPREKYPPQPLTEAAEPMPRTPYGASKLALEWLARSYRRRGLETVALRLGTVFGPGRLRHGAAEFAVTLFQEPAARRPVTVSEGDRTANMLYVEDAVAACLRAVQTSGPLADVYNISGFECSVSEMAREVARLLPAASIEVAPGGHSSWPTAMDGGAARRDLAYQPRFTLPRAVMDYLSALGCSFPTHSSQGTQ